MKIKQNKNKLKYMRSRRLFNFESFFQEKDGKKANNKKLPFSN